MSQLMLVQVKIELGHRASVRKALTDDGFTHDWTVFVRGPDGCDIANFIEKVVFNLHHSFVNYKREKTAPPYFVSESGYAGFTLPIDIYFKNKEEPRKIRFQYDLFLRMEASPPVNHTRCEKLTFQNPTEEFKKKLLEAGGTVVNANGEKETAQFTDLFGPPIQSDTVKKSKPHSSSKSKGITTSSGKSIPEPGSKDSSVHSAPSPSAPASLKSNTTTMTTMTTTTTSGSSSGSKSHKSSSKDKHSSSSLKRSSDISQDEGIKKSKKSLSASSLLEGKVKDKHGSGEKSKHSKEKDSTSSKHSSSKEKESSSKEKEASSKDSSSKDSSSKDSSSKDNSSKDMSSKDSSSKDNSSKDTSSKDSSSKDSSSKDNSSKNISSKDSSSKDISSKDSSSSSKHKEKSSSSKSHKSDKEKRKSSKSGKHESKPESSKDTVKSQVKNETVSSSVKVKSEPIEIKSETKMEILEERVNVKMETTSNNSPGGKPTHSKDSFVKERVSSSSHGKHSKEKSHRSGSSQPPVKKRKVISSSSEDSGSSSDNADIEEVLRRLKRIDSASGSEASVNEDDGEESTTRPSSVTSMASTNPSPQPTIQLQTKRALDRLMQDLSDQDDDDDDDDDYLIRSAFRSPVKSFSPSSVKSSHSSPGPGKSSKSSTSPAVKESPVVKESPSRKTSKQTTQSKSVLSPHSQKSSKSSHHSTVESKEHSSTASTPSTLSSQKTLSKSSSSSSKSKSDDRSESSKKDKGNSTFSKGSNSKCETVIKSESTAKEKKSKDKERKSSKESAKERKECKENISEGQFREDRPNANANNNNYASDTLETDLNGHGHIGLGGILEHNLGSAPNEEDLLSLLDLHKKLEAMKDGGILQQIVTVIMDTGKFEIGEASFNFDLCTLDSKTVERLQNFIGGSAS